MARADLLIEIIKHGLSGDIINMRRAVEAVCAEERAKQHNVLANKIEDILKTTEKKINKENHPFPIIRNNGLEQSLFTEKIPKKRLEQLLLPEIVELSCKELIEEQTRADLLRSYGIEPRNKILLIGPPGNGKTSLAEAVAEALMVPLLTVRYESIVGSYLGETASRLSKLMEYVKTRRCVLFFDEFETLGKERGDMHETGEIKRVVSSLLLHIDSLPSYVVTIGATNHHTLLDKATWRRFQFKLELPKPSKLSIEKWFVQFEKRMSFDLGLSPSTLANKTEGYSFAEVEELAFSVYRQYLLQIPNANTRKIVESKLRLLEGQRKFMGVDYFKGGNES